MLLTIKTIRPPLRSGDVYRHQTLGDVVVTRIVERRRYTFVIRVVRLDFLPWRDVDVDILVPRSFIFDYGPVTFTEAVKEYYWKVLDILRI